MKPANVMFKNFISTAKIGMEFLRGQDKILCCSIALSPVSICSVEVAIMLKRIDTDALFVVTVAVFVGGCVIWALAKWIGVIA
jgi:hypothetical protein